MATRKASPRTSTTRTTAKQTPTIPPLKKGEVYLGAILNADGTGHHSILLPGDEKFPHWDKAVAWAKKKGGTLPNRIEQAVLFANHAKEFKKDLYWSSVPYAGNESSAWYQSCSYGSQGNWSKDLELRARAVRRFPI